MYRGEVVFNMLKLMCSAMSGQSNDTCILCSRTGGDDQVMETVNTYIKENIGQVNLREIVAQIVDVLNEEEHQVTHEHVAQHITEHMKTPKVVMHHKLNELVSLSHLAKDACVYECTETGTQQIDAKMLGSYLKMVDRIVHICKMECMRA